MMDAHTVECLEFDRVRELLAGYAMTRLGGALARGIRPAANLAIVRRWLAQVDEMKRVEPTIGLPPFGGISDVRDQIKRCEPPLRLSVDDVAEIGRTLSGTHAVARYLGGLPEDTPELHVLAGRIGDFQTIANRISGMIDDRGQVRDEASQKLARLRARMREASEGIRTAIHRLLTTPAISRYLQYRNHTFHGDRTVLPVRAEARGRVPGIIHGTSDSGATVYVEPAEVVELNNQISKLRADETEEINRLLWELVHEIHINAEAILGTLDTLAILDLITAKLRFAQAFEMICPRTNDGRQINVRGARHPLLIDMARCKREAGEPPMEVVPIDYRIGDDFNMLVVTGPNTGGKTVALKTIGLLNMMVQAGLPVPVDVGSDIGMFSNIMIDVGDEQSLQQSLSTFSGHMTRIMDMLRRANDKTLVLIDELGAGTDPDEGAALGRAILDDLLRRQTRCVVTTHLGALKGFALSRAKVENGCVEFDIETLRPTYRLIIGEPGNSNAIDIAQRLGMPKRLINAAWQNLSRKNRALNVAIAGTLTSKRQAEAARSAAESARLAAEDARAGAADARTRLEQQQADFQEWLRHVVHLRAGDPVRVRNFDRDGRIVRMQLEQQRAEVDVGKFAIEVPLSDLLPPQAPPPPPPPVRAAPAPASSRRVKPPRKHGPPRRDTTPARSGGRPRTHAPRPELPSLNDEQLAALKCGDKIYAKRFHREGQIVRVNKAKKTVVVAVGALEMELPFGGLGLPPADPRSRSRGRAKTAPAKSSPKSAEATPPTREKNSKPNGGDSEPASSSSAASKSQSAKTAQERPPG
ncbi:MAG: DNA strand exchange inhibitor protein [Planctomycetes bacterium]|nr:DNA strand exchange inhibitor protein [Planctomycetota bacterium]